MRAFVTVIGRDRVGIIAAVCSLLAEMDINILDISQTIMRDNFIMIMLVDAGKSPVSFHGIAEALDQMGERLSLSIRIQREEIFNAMHKI